jgi:hypothetical protein
MVATRRNNPGVFEKPITIRVAGRDYTLTSHDAVVATIREMERTERSLNRQAAMAAFNLGMMLIAAADKLGYGSLNHLYNECGIHARKAERCIRFARRYAAADGTLDLAKYKQGECAARNRHESGEHPCKFDAEGHPSMHAVELAVGLRSDKRAESASSDRPVGTKHQTNPPAFRSPAEIAAPLMSATAAPAAFDSPRGAGGGQLAIDFDLIAAERKLADLVALAQRGYEGGDISGDAAERIHAALQGATRQTQSILETAKG